MSEYLIGYGVGVIVGLLTAFCYIKVRQALAEIFVDRTSRRLERHD